MENATKALLIAAAVLIAILIISLGLVVYNSSAETVKGIIENIPNIIIIDRTKLIIFFILFSPTRITINYYLLFYY